MQSSHPYRVIEKDGLSIHSMQSLGRVGRILSGSLDPGPFSSSSKESTQQNLQLESPTNVTSATSEKTDSFKSQHLQKSDDTISQSSNYSLVTSNSVSNQINTVLQEPDVIASTKLSQSKTTDSVSQLTRLDLIINILKIIFLDYFNGFISATTIITATSCSTTSKTQ